MSNTLDAFWECYGQKMNPEKSKLYFSKNTPLTDKEMFTTFFKSVREARPRYLGFPLTDKRPSASQVSHIAKKIRSKLANWKAKCLTKAGRLTLIKSTLTSVAAYSMQSLALPKKVLHEIDSLCANFLWGSSSDNHI